MLTAKQEKFVQNIIEGMNQSDAYRNSYSTKRMADKTIHENASRLMADSKVAARLQELRDQIMKPSIMSAQERLEYLTGIVNETKQEHIKGFVEGVEVEYERPADLNAKMKAIDIMNKMTGEYVTKVEGNLNVTKLEDLL